MNILVYNIAAEYAGALTILKEFYDEVVSYRDKSHNWYFVVSTDVLENTENINVIRVPQIKKSWLHRWWYDRYCAKKLVAQHHIDVVFSMQNMPISGAKCKQIVYLHQSLQFSPIRYSFWKREEREYWIRRHVICNMMRKSLRRADSIIVQTNWMKEDTQEWCKIPDKRIQVIRPFVNMQCCQEEVCAKEQNVFIYPATAGLHKNHELILEACENLTEKEIMYHVIFTMDGRENRYAERLYEQVQKKGLNVEFVGLLSKDEIMRFYKKAILLFPSYIEAFGLPLLEAKMSDGMILCSDLPFSHEILDDYEKAHFFDIDNAEQLADYMEQCIEGKLEKRQIEIQQNECDESWDDNFVECILKLGHSLVDKPLQ